MKIGSFLPGCEILDPAAELLGTKAISALFY